MKKMIDVQKSYFSKGDTHSYTFRREQLRRLRAAIKMCEEELLIALAKDMGKPYFEGYVSEVAVVQMEIRHALKHLKRWMQPRKMSSMPMNMGARSIIYPQPRGVTLIIAPWNYPFQLALSPLVAAIAAGNCALVKPSELTPNTSKVITDLIRATFDASYVAVVEGGVKETTELLSYDFDHIFFTGSPKVGKVVMQAAAAHLTPVTLELGGKSPCIVEPHINMSVAAERIIGGKMFNAGQTCVAPDYLLLHESIAEPFIAALKKAITKQHGAEPLHSRDFGSIVSLHHFLRLQKYLLDGEILCGGEHDEYQLRIAPTLLRVTDMNAPIMQEEIFGPILPILTYTDFEEVYATIERHPYPLALYLFSDMPRRMDEMLKRVRFGGGCLNDTMAHLLTVELPFGGVRTSGTGSYHGKAGFDTFTHYASVVRKGLKFNFPQRYPPHKDELVDFLRKWV